MASEPLGLTFNRAQIRRVAVRISHIVRQLSFGRIAPLTEEEADMLAEPGERLLHGRRKLQAAIHKISDPFLLFAAAAAIVETRVRPNADARPAAKSPAAARDESRAPARPAAPPAEQRSESAAPPAARETPRNPQDADLSHVKIDAAYAERALESIRSSIPA